MKGELFMECVHVVQTEYNFNSLVQLEALIKKVKQHGMTSVAIADNGTLYGVVDFLTLCKEEGINGIVGCTFSLTLPTTKATVTLFAKDVKGYQCIMKLSSMIQINGTRNNTLTEKELKRGVGHVVCVVDMTETLQKDLSKPAVVAKEILSLKQLYRDDFYLAITPEQTETIQKQLLSFSKHAKIPVMAMLHVCHLEEKHTYAATVLHAIHQGKKVVDCPPLKNRYFKTTDEMKQLFHLYPQAVDQTNDLAKKCQFTLPMKGEVGFVQKTPTYKVPKGFALLKNLTPLVQHMPGYTYPTDEEELKRIHYLVMLAWKGFAKLYKRDDKVAIQRLQYELGVIISKGYADYFLVIWDLLRYAKEKGIPFGARGSVLSVLLARCLGITEVCPIEYNLQFERFLNPHRSDAPDIDIDIGGKRRYEMIRYLQSKYGNHHVSQIMTFGTYGLTNAIKAVGKSLQLDNKSQARLIDLLPKAKKDQRVRQEVLAWTQTDEHIKKCVEIVHLLALLPKNTSRHAAGILVSEKPLTEEIPLWSGKDEEGEILVTQFANNEGQLEKLGFLKIDLLGLRNMDVVDETKKLIEQRYNRVIENIPLDDEKTLELYRKGELIGLFQVESDGMRQSSTLIQPSTINDIIALVALYRPGPKDEIEKYAKNKQNGQVVVMDTVGNVIEDASIRDVLKDTYGVLTYQEQVNQLAMIMGNYTISEADLLRRAISKKKKEVLDLERVRFVEKAVENQYEEHVAQAIYDLIVKFADYGLNKAHATSYAIFSYVTGWYKSNYPLEYMTTLINSMINTKKKNVGKAADYIEEARRMGISIQSPNVNTSYCDFTLEENKVQFGLSMVKNVGRDLATKIVNERKKGNFTSFEDFIRRVGKSVAIESLIKVGAFDTFGTRKSLLEQLRGNSTSKSESTYRFSDIPTIEADEPSPIVEDFTVEEKLAFEKELVCMYLTKTPLEGLKPQIDRVQKEQVARNKNNSVAAVVIGIRKMYTKKGKKEMAAIKAYTTFGEREFTVFPTEWALYKTQLSLFSPVLVTVKIDQVKKSVIIQHVEPIEPKEEVIITAPHGIGDPKRWLVGLTTIVRNYPGSATMQVNLGEHVLRKEHILSLDEHALKAIRQYVQNEENIIIVKSSV